jgi:hypothetical protein
MSQSTTATFCHQMSLIRATNTGAQEKQKYQLGNLYYCNDKAISHFREIAKNCQKEGFDVIEDLQQPDDLAMRG